jgi:hypothetical protein
VRRIPSCKQLTGSEIPWWFVLLLAVAYGFFMCLLVSICGGSVFMLANDLTETRNGTEDVVRAAERLRDDRSSVSALVTSSIDMGSDWGLVIMVIILVAVLISAAIAKRFMAIEEEVPGLDEADGHEDEDTDLSCKLKKCKRKHHVCEKTNRCDQCELWCSKCLTKEQLKKKQKLEWNLNCPNPEACAARSIRKNQKCTKHEYVCLEHCQQCALARAEVVTDMSEDDANARSPRKRPGVARTSSPRGHYI